MLQRNVKEKKAHILQRNCASCGRIDRAAIMSRIRRHEKRPAR